MYNTALSALGKAGRVDMAAALFRDIPQPDSISHETMVAAFGMAGRAAEAEQALAAMLRSGFTPRDFAYCGLIQGYRYFTPPCRQHEPIVQCLAVLNRNISRDIPAWYMCALFNLDFTSMIIAPLANWQECCFRVKVSIHTKTLYPNQSRVL